MPAAPCAVRLITKGDTMSSGPGISDFPSRSSRAILPTTRLGRWAVGLGAANAVLVLGWRLMGPLGGFPGFVCGLAGGFVALVAIFRRGERAFTVFAAIVPLVFFVLFVLLELTVGHD
jgi:hypothetical protein